MVFLSFSADCSQVGWVLCTESTARVSTFLQPLSITQRPGGLLGPEGTGPASRHQVGGGEQRESQSRSCSLEACVPLLAWVPGAGCWIAALRCASLVVHSHRWTLLPNGGPMAAAPKAAPAWLTPSVGTRPPRVLIHSPPPPRHPATPYPATPLPRSLPVRTLSSVFS